MIGTAPKFMTSPWFVLEAGNWHLKDGAPADVVQEFNEFMQGYDEQEAQNEEIRRKQREALLNR
ncbi:MAG: hypothetical protein IKW14_03500 [Phascolarctobacterium sp.]|nr:hypothetical protein [Phascolarctobacterium sp.]